MYQKLLTVIEVARILQVSKTYIYKLISNGDLLAMKYSRVIRIQKEDLDQFIQTNTNERKENKNEKQ
jgi:excisionase family DNA binding protein